MALCGEDISNACICKCTAPSHGYAAHDVFLCEASTSLPAQDLHVRPAQAAGNAWTCSAPAMQAVPGNVDTVSPNWLEHTSFEFLPLCYNVPMRMPLSTS